MLAAMRNPALKTERLIRRFAIKTIPAPADRRGVCSIPRLCLPVPEGVNETLTEHIAFAR
jgi:hypothetical protein